MKRRTILKILVASLPWLKPLHAVAAGIREAFSASSLEAAQAALHSGRAQVNNDTIVIEAPGDTVEDGAVVPLRISANLPGARTIDVFAEQNPFPLVARFELGPGTLPDIETRIKMARSAYVWVTVETDGGALYSNRRYVEIVGAGGCGTLAEKEA